MVLDLNYGALCVFRWGVHTSSGAVFYGKVEISAKGRI
jgi:hypothetical protein